MGIKRYIVHYGQFHLGPLMGPELQRASYGPKDVMGHKWAGSYIGLESYWMTKMTLVGLNPVGRKVGYMQTYR